VKHPEGGIAGECGNAATKTIQKLTGKIANDLGILAEQFRLLIAPDQAPAQRDSTPTPAVGDDLNKWIPSEYPSKPAVWNDEESQPDEIGGAE
jgi:hypothetical protein